MNSKIYYGILMIIVLSLSLKGCRINDNTSNKLDIIVHAKNDEKSPFYINSRLYNSGRASLPIGVFDSGTGGLAVLEAILALDEFNNETHLPGSDDIPDFISESFTYLADEANMPYGRYDAEGKAGFLRELVVKDVIFLCGNRYYAVQDDKDPQTDKKPVKEIVIACNTATAYGLETVKEAAELWELPVEITGIIEAGALSALDKISSQKISKPLVAIFATEGTCSSGGYPKTILKEAAIRNPDLNIEVIQYPGIGLAGAIDGDINYIDPSATSIRSEEEYFGPGIRNNDYPLNKKLFADYNFNADSDILISTSSEDDTLDVQLNSIKSYVNYMVSGMVQHAADQYPDRTIDIVILGCTHYPYVEDYIRDHFTYLDQQERYSDIIPDSIIIIDPSKSLARILYTNLVSKKLLANNSMDMSEFYISLPNKDLADNRIDDDFEFPYEWKYGRSENSGLQYVKIVPFSDSVIDQEILQRIKNQLPLTNNLIK